MHVNGRPPLRAIALALLCAVVSRQAMAMTVTGPVVASTVSVFGSVTLSSVTASSVTINNSLNVEGTVSGIQGRTVQMSFSSTTIATGVTATTNYTAVDGLTQTIALKNASNYLRISISGVLSNPSAGSSGPSPYITLYRDSINLGDPIYGIATADVIPGVSIAGIASAVAITMLDFPGDTLSHVYQVYIRCQIFGQAEFPSQSTGYLVLEEIGK